AARVSARAQRRRPPGRPGRRCGRGGRRAPPTCRRNGRGGGARPRGRTLTDLLSGSATYRVGGEESLGAGAILWAEGQGDGHGGDDRRPGSRWGLREVLRLRILRGSNSFRRVGEVVRCATELDSGSEEQPIGAWFTKRRPHAARIHYPSAANLAVKLHVSMAADNDCGTKRFKERQQALVGS